MLKKILPLIISDYIGDNFVQGYFVGVILSGQFWDYFVRGNFFRGNSVRGNSVLEPEQTEMNIGDHEIASAPRLKYLGVMLDDRINFNSHVDYVCEKAMKVRPG